MKDSNENKSLTALLIGVYRKSSEREICNEHLEELEHLADTCEIPVKGKVACSLRKIETSTYLTKGKLEEVVAYADELDVGVIIFDDEILPSQQRNLEGIFKRKVIDRTEVIIDVFAKHARSKEARLQVELAKVRYQLPRLKKLWNHLHRQKGGGVHLKGEGEKQIEIDKRLLNTRISSLQRDIEEVRIHRDTQRRARQRSGVPTFAIIGYTNAGKSTLLNALTDAKVLVEDKLFATLDTTTREFVLPNNQDILLIDTVGFIRKLPHTLIAAFKSTLEESVYADILLHIVDASHPMFAEQAEATYEVLKELNASDKQIITVLNKMDLCDDISALNSMCINNPKTVAISALNGEGFEDLTNIMIRELSERVRIVKLRIPQSSYDIISEIMRHGRVLSQEYEDNDIIVMAEIPAELVGKVAKFVE